MYLLLDQGGQSTRAMVLDTGKQLRAEARVPLKTRESGDRVEQDAAEILLGLETVIDQVLRDLDPTAATIEAAGLGIQRGSIVCWRRSDGAPLSPVISWRDRRTVPWPGGAPGPERVRQLSGLRDSPYGGALKLRWCLENLSDVQQAASNNDLLMGPLGSFLLYRLLSEPTALVDPTLAQRTLLFDHCQGDWSDELIRAAALDRRFLPSVVSSHFHFGTLQRKGHAVPFRLLQGDQNAVPWMDGRPDPQTLYVNLGTGAFLLRPAENKPAQEIDPGPFQLSLLGNHPGGSHAREGSIHGAGAALQFLGRHFNRDFEPEEIEQAMACSEPPLFINTVGGLGSPWWQAGPDPHFRNTDGEVVAIPEDPQPALAGVLESMAFLLRHNLDAIEAWQGPVERIILSGGLSQSQGLGQVIQALCQRQCWRLPQVEATLMGLWCQLADCQPSRAFVSVPAMSGNKQYIDDLNRRYRQWSDCLAQLCGQS